MKFSSQLEHNILILKPLTGTTFCGSLYAFRLHGAIRIPIKIRTSAEGDFFMYQVVKRDGKLVDFSIDKISAAIILQSYLDKKK